MRGTALTTLLLCAGALTLLFYVLVNLYAYAYARGGRFPLYRDFYECGFKAVPDARIAVDVQFGLLGVVFLIYDMEIILLAPVLLNGLSLPGTAQIALVVVIGVLGLSY